MENDQPVVFLYIVNNTIVGNVFPDNSLILLTLELILVGRVRIKNLISKILIIILNFFQTINKPSEDRYTTKEVIERSVLTFSNLLQIFPPCWIATNESYRQILLEPLKNSQFLKSNFIKNLYAKSFFVMKSQFFFYLLANEFDSKLGLFQNLLNLLEIIIDPDYATDPLNCSINSEDYQDFFKWEAKNQQKYLV